jgi:ABC-type antimicrobial peptide transport system permease subunit
MTLFRLLLRSLTFHWRGNSAVLLGVAVGTAVLTGALLVGDSLRGSLRERTLERLEWIDQALVAPRFFRAKLAEELQEDSAANKIVHVIFLQGTASKPQGPSVRAVTIVGAPPQGLVEVGSGPKATLSGALATALGAKEGDKVVLRLPKPGEVPREAALGRKDVGIEELELTVARVLQGAEPGNLFNLRPELEAPRTAFVPLNILQKLLDQPGRINGLLAGGGENLAEKLRDRLTLEDWGLVIQSPSTRAAALMARFDRNQDGVLKGREWFEGGAKNRKPRFARIIAEGISHKDRDAIQRAEIEAYYKQHHPYLSLESKQLLLEPAVSEVALEAAEAAGLRAAPSLVYLARISSRNRRIAGVVAALDPTQPPPLGPFLPPHVKRLTNKEIILVDWGWEKERPTVGTLITLTFKPAESHGTAADRKVEFRLAGWLPIKGAAADPGLTPDFPGITDKERTSDWTLPFDDPAWDQQSVRKEYTDLFWDDYRATPKAYINLEAGQKLWKSRFGDLTSIRLAPQKGLDLQKAEKRLRVELLKRLDPARGGFLFEEVKREALLASKGGGFDFSWLFLGFSTFLIAAALLLVGLLTRLNLDRRAPEMGLLFAEGFRRRTVLGLLAGEGAVLAVIGVILGTLSALAYSGLLVQLLAALWPGGALKSLLRPHATPTSLTIGAATALAASILTIAWAVRSLSRIPPRALLAGQTTGEGEWVAPGKRWGGWWMPAALASLAIVLLAIGPLVPGHEAQAGTFFGGGAFLLGAFLSALWAWLRKTRGGLVEGHGWLALGQLGIRNAGRHPARSLLTAGLLASAVFLVVAVEVFRRHAKAGDGADGGFALMAETDLPLVRDLNTTEGRNDLLEKLERNLIQAGQSPAEAKKEIDAAQKLLEDSSTQFVAFRARAGDDASCLNLYQPRRPRVLGVPANHLERGGFIFAQTQAKTAEEKANPWLLLRERDKGIPAFGEANTVTWMLGSNLGGTVSVVDGKGNSVDLILAGLLQDSVFQSSLLISEQAFLEMYPNTEGYQFFLIQSPAGREAELKNILERALSRHGMEVTFTKNRLEAFQAVENTYLTTFQALGGLGLLLGSLGLAVVLLRGVWERRAELALLRALGYRRSALAWLVLAENGFLILVGLVGGTAAALLAVAPNLLTGVGSIPWAALFALLAGTLAVGFLGGALALVGSLRAPLVPALRRE